METITVPVTKAQWDLYEGVCRLYADQLRDLHKADVVLVVEGKPVCLSMVDKQSNAGPR